MSLRLRKRDRKSYFVGRRRNLHDAWARLALEPLEARMLLTTAPEFSALVERHADDAAARDHFGYAVDFQDNIAVVSASRADAGARDSGAAYIFEHDPRNPSDPNDDVWEQVHKLVAFDGARSDGFGTSVAISGNLTDGYIIAVGAANVEGGGAVYVLTGNLNVWSDLGPEIAVGDEVNGVGLKLTAGDGGDWFGDGNGVSIDGNTIVVGARGHDGVGKDSGKVYVFECDVDDPLNLGDDSCSLQQDLAPLDPSTGQWFGFSVDVSVDDEHGNTIVVGAEDAAYVFEDLGSGWEQTGKLTRPRDTYSWAVEISDTQDTIVVGTGTGAAAWTYARGGDSWGDQLAGDDQELIPWDSPGSRFGGALDISGDILLVNGQSGSYVFKGGGTTWNQYAKLNPDQPWGTAGVATNGTLFLVGNHLDDGLEPGGPDLTDVGSVHVFHVEPVAGPPSIESLIDNPDPVFQGADLTLTASGVSDDQTVERIDFFRDANGNDVLDVGTDMLVGSDMDGSDGWNTIVPIEADRSTGVYTYFAQATDNDLELSNVVSATNEVVSTVVTIAATDANAAEPADEGTFTVTRTGNVTGDLVILYSASGTAMNGVDYAALSGSVTIPGGATTAPIDVTPLDDENPEGDETVVLTLAPGDYSIGTPDSDTVTIADDDQPPEVYDYAIEEMTSQGSVVSGSLLNTYVSDNGYEAIEERRTGGKPAKRQSLLEHRWTFDLTGTALWFEVEAHHTDNNEGDDFIFQYSTNGSDYYDMMTVIKTADDESIQSHEFLPADNISGTMFVRVVDLDQTPGNSVQDTLYIDYMSFVSATI